MYHLKSLIVLMFYKFTMTLYIKKNPSLHRWLLSNMDYAACHEQFYISKNVCTGKPVSRFPNRFTLSSFSLTFTLRFTMTIWIFNLMFECFKIDYCIDNLVLTTPRGIIPAVRLPISFRSCGASWKRSLVSIVQQTEKQFSNIDNEFLTG